MVTLKRLNTTYTKDNDNPVQMDLDKIFLYRSLNKKHSQSNRSLTSSTSSSSINHDTDIKDSTARTANLRRINSAVLETKMRDRTAHIGRKASFASQGMTWSW